MTRVTRSSSRRAAGSTTSTSPATPTTPAPAPATGPSKRGQASPAAPATRKKRKVGPAKTAPAALPDPPSKRSRAAAFPNTKSEPLRTAIRATPPPPVHLPTAFAHLAAVDPRWGPVCSAIPCRPFVEEGFGIANKNKDPFRSLVSSIIGQQVSWLAARSIRRRFVEHFCGPTESLAHDENGPFPTREEIAKSDVALLKTLGLSTRKAEYIIGLAERFVSGELSDDLLYNGSDEEVAEALIAVRGIGRWTVDMFMMFTLRRGDVLPVGDLGVQKGLLRWALAAHGALPAPKVPKTPKTPKKGKSGSERESEAESPAPSQLQSQDASQTTPDTTYYSAVGSPLASRSAKAAPLGRTDTLVNGSEPPTPIKDDSSSIEPLARTFSQATYISSQEPTESQLGLKAEGSTPGSFAVPATPPRPRSAAQSLRGPSVLEPPATPASQQLPSTPAPPAVTPSSSTNPSLPSKRLAEHHLHPPAEWTAEHAARAAPLGAGLSVELMRSRLAGKKAKGNVYLLPAEMEVLTEAWRPYRSIGIYYTWSMLGEEAS